MGNVANVLTDERLTEIRARVNNTWDGPWVARTSPDGWCYIAARSLTVARNISEMNARFIAHAPADMKLLLGEIERLRGLLT